MSPIRHKSGKPVDTSDVAKLARECLDPRSAYSANRRIVAIAQAYLDLLEKTRATMPAEPDIERAGDG